MNFEIDTEWIRKKILEWYATHGRRFPWRSENLRDPYIILVTELLLQKTRAEMVERVWHHFFNKFPTIADLARAAPEEIFELIGGLGLKYRVWRLKKMAQQIMQLFNGEIPSECEDLLKLTGVGPYAANAVMCFAYNKRKPIVDVNVMRVMNRFTGLTDEISIRKFLDKVLPRKAFKQFNWGLLDLAQLICKSNEPLCFKCPLSAKCPKFEIRILEWRILRKYIKNGQVFLRLQKYTSSR